MRALLVLALVAAPAVVPAVAHADRRSLSFAYDYQTQPEGETEIELFTTQSRATWADGAPEAFELALGLEHGITARWDVALTHVFNQASGAAATASPLQLGDVELRTRYRFAERGQRPVDVVAYASVARQFGASAYLGEARAIVARDFGRLTVVADAIGQVGFGAEIAEPAIGLGWAGGVTYELSPTWTVGAESWGDVDVEHTDRYQTWAGPALSWAPSSRLWVTATGGFGLNDRSDRFTLRGVVGLAL